MTFAAVVVTFRIVFKPGLRVARRELPRMGKVDRQEDAELIIYEPVESKERQGRVSEEVYIRAHGVYNVAPFVCPVNYSRSKLSGNEVPGSSLGHSHLPSPSSQTVLLARRSASRLSPKADANLEGKRERELINPPGS